MLQRRAFIFIDFLSTRSTEHKFCARVGVNDDISTHLSHKFWSPVGGGGGGETPFDFISCHGFLNDGAGKFTKMWALDLPFKEASKLNIL